MIHNTIENKHVSRIEGQCTNREVYQAQRPRCGSFALSNSAVWIIRTIHLAMAQVIESEIRKREVPYPLLGGRDTSESGLFRSLLWRRVGFQGVTGIVMEGSPAPTHFSRVSEAGSSPGQCQVMFAQNAPSATSYNQQPQQPQQPSFDILLRQLTSISIPAEALEQLGQSRQLEEVVESMTRRHTVHERLFLATDQHVRLLHQRHDSLMSQLQQFESQQEGRWLAYSEADRLQQASFNETVAQVQDMVCKVQSLSTKLDEARSNLGLLQEAVGALQADVAACDAKIDAVFGKVSVLSSQSGQEEGAATESRVHASIDHSADAHVINPQPATYRQHMELLMKQLLEERARREALDDKLSREISVRQQMERRLVSLEQRQGSATAVPSATQVFAMSPEPSSDCQPQMPMDATDSWWHFGAGPPGLTNQPPRIPENLRRPGPVEGQQPVADRMRETYGRALGVNLEVSDAGQTGRMDEQEEHQDKGASSGGAHADDAVDVDKIPEGRWKLLKDLQQLELTGARTWEQGVQLASWRAQCSTIFNGVGYSFAQYAQLVWSQAEKMYSDKAIGMKKPEVPMIRTEHLDYEARLTSALLRILPEAIKTPAVERADDGCISSAMLCMGILSRLQPAGPEEATSLLSFLRSPPTATTAQELEGLLRRYNLALRRLHQLQMPPMAPSETLKALQAMTRAVERKYNSFHMRLNLLRLFPEASTRPTEEGVSKFKETVEQQLHEITADEIARESKNRDLTTVSRVDTGSGGQGSDTSKRGICHFFSKPGGCYRKNCPFQHVADLRKGKPKGDDGRGKGKGKGKDKDGKGKVQQVESSQTSSPNAPSHPEGKAKAKADPKGKPKGKAKAEAQKLLGVDDAKPKVSMIRVGPIAGRFPQFEEEPDSRAEPQGIHIPLEHSGGPGSFMWSETHLYALCEASEGERFLASASCPNRAVLQFRHFDVFQSLPESIWSARNTWDFDGEVWDNDGHVATVVQSGECADEYVVAIFIDHRDHDMYRTIVFTQERKAQWHKQHDDQEIWPPTVAKASTPQDTVVDAPGWVLLDSGANEVCRPLDESLDLNDAAKFIPLNVTLASGQESVGYRSVRDGEVVMDMNGSSEWIAGIQKLASIGRTFTWGPQGAVLHTPDGDVQEVMIRNGLPFISWEKFKRLRSRLSKSHRQGPQMQLGRSWNASVTEAAPAILVPGEHMGYEAAAQKAGLKEEPQALEDAVDETEAQAKQWLERGSCTWGDLLALLVRAKLKLRRRRRHAEGADKEQVAIWNFGRWCHGGCHGMTVLSRTHPWLTKLMASLISKDKPDFAFTTITVTEDTAFLPHRDKFNAAGTMNYARGLTRFTGGQIWIHDVSAAEDKACAWRQVRAGKDALPGRLLDTCQKSVVFDGRATLHGTEPFSGHRVMILAYTPRGIEKASSEELTALARLGFKHPVINEFEIPRRMEDTTDGSSNPTSEASPRKQHISVSCSEQANTSLPSEVKVRFRDMPEVHEYSEAKGLFSESEIEYAPTEVDVDDDGIDQAIDLRVEKGSKPSVKVDGKGKGGFGSGEGDWAVIGPDDTFDQMLDKLGLAEDISRDASARADGTDDSDDPEKVLRRKCLDGFFKHGCPECTGSRGHRRLHRKLKNQPVSEGTLNIDVSGPHGESIDKQRYFLAAVLLMPDGTCIPFAKCMETKTANETRKKLTEVLAQVVAMSDGQVPLLRVHSDCGGEFTADSMCAYFRRMGLWKTKSVPYCKQSSGKVERAIQTIKHQSTSLLLHGGLPAIFWTFAVQHAVYVLRAAALEIPCPKDARIFGSLVAVKKPHSEAFESRVEQGIYLGADDSFVDGANVLVQRDGEGGMKIIKSRLPVLLNVPKPTWKKSLSPDEEHEVWISSEGEVRWTAPHAGEITTFEERTDGPQYDDPTRYRNLEQAIKRKLHGHDERDDLPDLVRFNHGFLVAEPSCLKAKVETDGSAGNAEAEGKYVVLVAEYEEEQIRQEMETLLSGAERASARAVDNHGK